MDSIPPMDTFISNRWDDAKEALRKLDQHFVSKLESEVRLQEVGLQAPWSPAVDTSPKRRLSRQWHQLLEACLELTIQASNVQVAATSVADEATKGLSAVEIGRQSDYHFRSWFIHSVTLAEQCELVIDRTVTVYISDRQHAKELTKRHRGAVDEQIVTHIRETRNRYVHPRRGAWASGLTDDGLWESLVAVGMTPGRLLSEFHYPDEARRAREGAFAPFIDGTTTILERIGAILTDLEADIR